jgi:hypothetical protein
MRIASRWHDEQGDPVNDAVRRDLDGPSRLAGVNWHLRDLNAPHRESVRRSPGLKTSSRLGRWEAQELRLIMP